MERELCLVLDTLGKHRLVLESGTNYEIDEYTSKNFEDSSQIRQIYKEEIEQFLSKYKDELEKSNNPSYTGRIVVVIPENVGKEMKYYQRRVLYKKHIATFDGLLKNKMIMTKFSDYEKKKNSNEKIVSDYFCDVVKRTWNKKNSVRKYIDEWIKSEKKKKTLYYEIVRDMMLVYEQEIKYKQYLPSIDDLYYEYKKEKERKNKERLKKRGKTKLQNNTNHTIVEGSVVIEETEKYYNVNGNMYTADELHLLDLDDIDLESSDYIPDGVKKK